MRFISRGASSTLVGLAAFALLVVAACLQYRWYLRAIAWHCLHGNHAEVAGHRVALPLVWWEEKDPLHWDTYHLVRACPGPLCPSADIEIGRVNPALQTNATETDQQELEKDRRMVSLFNQRQPQSNASIVVIRTPAMNLDCVRGSLGVSLPGGSGWSICGAPGFPYTISFHAPTSEREAESILSTLQ